MVLETGHGLWRESDKKKMMKSESQWGVLWSTKEPENSQSGAVWGEQCEQCGGRRRTRPKMKFTVCLLPGFLVVTVKKHQLGGRTVRRVAPPQGVAGRDCGTQLVHDSCSLHAHGSPMRLLSPLDMRKNWDSGQLGELPKSKHPASILPRLSPKPAFLLFCYLTASQRRGSKEGHHPLTRGCMQPAYAGVKSPWKLKMEKENKRKKEWKGLWKSDDNYLYQNKLNVVH